MLMAEKPRRKRRRVLSSDVSGRQNPVSSDEKSCSETCEEELFKFTNKKASLEDLEEETLKQVRDELYDECRYEDIGDEGDRRKWKRRADYTAWNVVDKQLYDSNSR